MDGDRERRFEVFYERHYGMVLAYARRRLDEAAARDITAETFLVAWRRLDEATTRGLPWLYRTAHLTMNNWHRGERRASRATARLASLPADYGPDPAVGYAERQAAVDVLRTLPTADQELLLLVTWEQLTPTEAARVVGCSAATAAVRLHRARRRLRAALQDPAPASSPTASRTSEVTS